MCADRAEGGSDHTPDTRDQKDGAQDQDQGTETLGQRLLQEPIWIGLIVILSVIFLSGVFYLIRRKWGRKFNCCDIKKPKEDDNILNADGTITLNSFPLKRITRPPTLSPISVSPSHRSCTLSETPTPNPSANNHSAAARFFASYKDAERSPISTTVTTDFIRTCDTSLSHDVGDSSVGAIVGGRLLLNLHAKEQQRQEAMTRAQSLMSASTRETAKDKIKRSHSLGPFLKGNDSQSNERPFGPETQPDRDRGIFSIQSSNARAQVVSKGNRVQNINDMDHIYPNVIVHASQNFHSDDEDDDENNDDNCKSRTSYSPQYQPVDTSREAQTDRSGARIIQVDIEGGSSGSGEGSSEQRVSLVKRSPRFSLNHVSRSADSILDPLPQNNMQFFTNDYEFMQKDKLQVYAQMLGEWKNRARQRYRLAKIAAQKEKQELYEHRLREKAVKYGGRIRSSLCRHHRKIHTAPHPLRRTKTVDVDHSGSAHDISLRRAQFSGRQGRQFTSMEDLERHERKRGRRHPRNCMNENDDLPSFTDCDCPECLASISVSFNSDMSSLVRSATTSQDLPVYSSTSYNSERYRTDRSKPRTVSTTSDPLKRRSHRSFRLDGSFQRKDSMRSISGHKYRQRRSRHGSGPTKTTRTLHVNNALSSSTDSDFNWRVIHSKQSSTDKQASPGRSFSLGIPQRAPPAVYNEVNERECKTFPPYITDIATSKTDVFHTIFSQVVESDDLHSAGEEDEAYIIESRPSAKQNIIHSIPLSRGPETAENVKDSEEVGKKTSNLAKISCGNGGEILSHQPKESLITESETPSKFSNRCNSIITVRTTGSLEGKAFKTSSQGSSTSREKSENSCGTPTTCNVIVYDSSASFDTTGTPPKSKFILSKKHSSLDLSNPHRLEPGQAALRNASSLQELSNQPEENVYSPCTSNPNNFTPERASSLIDIARTSTRSSGFALAETFHTPATDFHEILNSSRTSEVNMIQPKQALQNQRNTHAVTTPYQDRPHPTNKDSIAFVPKTPTSSVDDSYIQSSGRADGSAFLSVTDTDPSSGSAPSTQTTPNSKSHNKNLAQKVKDSAYQTKQSSVDVEANLEARTRRYPQTPKEEERRVTQRLHQAAVKLIVMQQRLRRARQHLSKDSAVHTISEDDPSLDDIIVVSPKTRTFKPGVLYPAQAMREGETIVDFPPTIYGRIIEEQDPSVEYEV